MPKYTVTPATRTTGTEVRRGWVVERAYRGDKTCTVSVLYDTEEEAVVQAIKLKKQEGTLLPRGWTQS
jgi:hypothetical protein